MFVSGLTSTSIFYCKLAYYSCDVHLSSYLYSKSKFVGLIRTMMRYLTAKLAQQVNFIFWMLQNVFESFSA